VLIYQYAGRPQEEFQILAAAGVLLMLVVLTLINSFAIWLRARYERTW
jgi:phosphate transport system permease protein